MPRDGDHLRWRACPRCGQRHGNPERCPVTRDPDDPRLRLRLYIDGALVDEDWIDATAPNAQTHIEATQRRHGAAAARADERGSVWMAEVYNPAAPDDDAYLRFGTDPGGMHEPRPIHTLTAPDGWPL